MILTNQFCCYNFVFEMKQSIYHVLSLITLNFSLRNVELLRANYE